MNRIADLRTPITGIDEADRVFADLALASKRLAVEDARFERDDAARKIAYEQRTADLRGRVGEIKARLAAFINANLPLFAKPRKRKTAMGEYGLRTVTTLEITDEAALFDALMDLGYDDCMETVRTPVKPAIRDRLKAGETIPGCSLNRGDTAVCKVSKALLDEAKREAVG